jgi:gliding motility-associated-like protein
LDCAFWGTSEIQVRIINRWGEIVFESSANNILWDGNYNGAPCMEGTYAMIIEYKGNKQGKRIAYSTITLLRTKSQ